MKAGLGRFALGVMPQIALFLTLDLLQIVPTTKAVTLFISWDASIEIGCWLTIVKLLAD